MRKLMVKLFPIVIALTLVLSVMPISAFAVTTVTDEDSLKAAVANGGEITVSSDINMTSSIDVTKDTVIYLNGGNIVLGPGYNLAYLFSVSGANLTIIAEGNVNNAIRYSGKGSTYLLTGVSGENTSVTLENGSHSAANEWDHEIGGFAYPKSVFEVVVPSGAIVPTITLKDGSYSCEENDPETNYPTGSGDIICGNDAGFKIESGSFFTEINEKYLDSDSVCFYGEMNGYQVLKIDKTVSDKFASILNKEGNLTVKRFEPASEEEIWTLNNFFYYKYMDIECDPRFNFHIDSFDLAQKTLYISLIDDNELILETHKIKLDFVYDKNVKTKIDEIVASMPKGEDMGGGYFEPHIFKVNDLELINYWLTCDEETDNTNKLINYSDEFKKTIGYKNFEIDTGYGADERFITFAGGDGNFALDGTIYASPRMEVQGDHIIYVPDDTALTGEAMFAAAQKRVDDYLGKDKVTFKYEGTLFEVLDRDNFAETGEHLDPAIDMESEIGIEGVKSDDFVCSAEINGIKYQMIIWRGSDKMVVPTYKNVDAATDISVSSEDSSVPLDTLIRVDEVTEGEEYDKINKAIDADVMMSYDIKLHSGAADKYVTKLENGKFKVEMPITEELKTKNLKVYYVDDKGEAIQYAVTIDYAKNMVAFETDHFSIYTLAATNPATSSAGSTGNQPSADTQTKSPETGSGVNMIFILSLAVLSGVYIFLKIKNKVNN